MLIITRIYLFFQWAVVLAIVAVILLMIMRMVVTYTDLNPFGSIALTTRRLTDSIVAPIRRGLVGFGVDPKYAPLVVILLIIVVGWFALQIVSNITNTILGILWSLGGQAFIPILGYILYGLVDLYGLLILIRIVFSWVTVSYYNRIMRFLVGVTEPLLGPLRRMIPPVGMFDISPIVAFIILWILKAAIVGTLLQGARLNFLP